MAKDKKKKSFFGKLLGTEEPPKQVKTSAKNKQSPEPKKQDPPKEATVEAETEASEEDKSEEWLQDYEGQLTIDVYQTPNDIIIRSTIAGVKPEDIDIAINDDMITIKGERNRDVEIKEEDYFYQECYWGGFSRSVILPVEVQADKTDAELKNGILTVKLPKANTVKTKKISVKGS